MKKLLAILLVVALCFTTINYATSVKAESEPESFEIQNFHFNLWWTDEGMPSSLLLTGYTGSETELVLPTVVIYKGFTIPVVGLDSNALAGNTNITKVIVPNGYESIGSNAFNGCINLAEIIIAESVMYISEAAFEGCPNLKTYRFGNKDDDNFNLWGTGMGMDETGDLMDNVVAYVIRGSAADENLREINEEYTGGNQIDIRYEADPAAAADVTRVLPEEEPTTTVPTTTVPTTTKAGGESTEPSNPYEKGASYDKADKAITNYSSENDVPGSVYGLLQLKQKKVKKNAIKVGWKKVPGAVKYAYYATNCGPKNKYVKHGITTGTSFNYKTILGKKLKKGSYYKFIVIAIDAKSKVVSTSKTVHVATKGGKVTNDKKVKVKKKKASIKVNKIFKIKAKEVTPKKGKVKRHRKIKYESLNTSVATVNGKGVVKGVKKGTTTVFAYAQNGFAGKVKITVK